MATTVTAQALTQDFVTDFAHRWMDAWNRHDAEAVAELCTDDVEFTDPALGTVHGRPAVAEWVRTCGRAFPDYRFEEPEPPLFAADRQKVIAPWVMHGHNTGPLEPPGFAATGRTVRIEGVDHWWIRDGLVHRYRADYDSADAFRQLGLLPPRGSSLEAAMARAQRLGKRVAASLGR